MNNFGLTKDSLAFNFVTSKLLEVTAFSRKVNVIRDLLGPYARVFASSDLLYYSI